MLVKKTIEISLTADQFETLEELSQEYAELPAEHLIGAVVATLANKPHMARFVIEDGIEE